MAGKNKNRYCTIKDDCREYYKGEVLIRKIKRPSGIRYQVDLGKLNGPDSSAARFTFKTLADARERAQKHLDDREAVGAQAKALTANQAIEMVKAMERLKEYDVSLEAVVEYWISHHQQTTTETRVGALVKTYVAQKRTAVEKGGLRPTTLLDIVSKMKTLEPVADRHIASITEKDIARLLKSFSGLNYTNRRRAIKSFFKWAGVSDNPVSDKTALKIQRTDDVTFYAVNDVARLMMKAEEIKPAVVPFMALSFFAGIRSEEIGRMTWSMIDFKNNEIRLPATITKKHRKRTIKMEPCLRSWLELSGCPGSGPILQMTLQTAFKWRRKSHLAAGIEPVPNGGRHSYGSYGYQFYNLKDLLSFMGHRSSEILVDHYKGEAKPEEASEYFGLVRSSDKILQLRRSA